MKNNKITNYEIEKLKKNKTKLEMELATRIKKKFGQDHLELV